MVLLDGLKTVWNIRPEVYLFLFSSSSVTRRWRYKAFLTSLWTTTNGEVHSKHSAAWLPFRRALMRELVATLWNEADNSLEPGIDKLWPSVHPGQSLASSSAGTDLWAIVASSLSMSWQGALAANWVPGFVNSSTARRLREKLIRFYSGLLRLCLHCHAQLWGMAQYRKDTDKLGKIQQRPPGWPVAGVLALWEETQKWGFISLGKRGLRGNLAATFLYLWGSYGEDWGRLFCWDVWLEVDSLIERRYFGLT